MVEAAVVVVDFDKAVSSEEVAFDTPVVEHLGENNLMKVG